MNRRRAVWKKLLPAAAIAGVLAGVLPAFAQSPAKPFEMPSSGPESRSIMPGPFRSDSDAGPASAQGAAGPAISAPAQSGGIGRYVLPLDSLTLTGEIDARAWTVWLSEAQAGNATSFSIRFTNSILIVPEDSLLRVTINGRDIVASPIDAANGPTTRRFNVPPGALNAGENVIRIQARQTHRVDCSPEATYELWTRVFSEGTGLVFAEGADTQVKSLQDLAAIGVNARGETSIRMIGIDALDPAGIQAALEMVQQAALLGRFPHPVATASADLPAPQAGAGELAVIVGTADQIEARLGFRPEGADRQAVYRFMRANILGLPAMVISGPTDDSLRDALRQGLSALSTVSLPAGLVATSAWHWPDTPVLAGADSVTFAELGLASEEFTGRRYQTRFMVALAPDFYAAAYGTAVLKLDAAFASDALPSSRIDIYVNDQIASTFQIRVRGGMVFKGQPIRIPLRNLRPGINELRLEAIIETEADRICLPGDVISAEPRFALFDTTTFDVPDYARITRVPDLAPLAAGGLPYVDQSAPVRLELAGSGPETAASAGTLLARLATVRNAPFPFEVAEATAGAKARSAIVVGPVGSIGNDVLRAAGVDEASGQAWRSAAQARSRMAAENDDALDTRGPAETRPPADSRPAPPPPDPGVDLRSRWTDRVSGSPFERIARAFQTWLQDTFSITLPSFALGEDANAPVSIPADTRVFVAQNAVEDSSRVLTVVTGPDGAGLAAGVAEMSAPRTWSRLAGRTTAFGPNRGMVTTTPVQTFSFVVTSPLRPQNIRLIASNWFSEHIALYALVLGAACIVLGIATAFLLRHFGRTE